MINFDFDYYRPDTLKEAHDLFVRLSHKGQEVIYYAGGTEVLTAFRKGSIKSDAVIDLKAVPGMTSIDKSKEYVIGACTSLNDVSQACPELGPVFDGIGDHTARNTITIGGNICGRLPYKEVLLPLLAQNAKVVVYNSSGLREYDLRSIFSKKLNLAKGDILYQIKINFDKLMVSYRFSESAKVDYPLVHLLFAKESDAYFVALSGYGSYPIFKSFDTMSRDRMLSFFKPYVKDCLKGNGAYKHALLSDALQKAMEEIDG